jgi:hypothetical protein
MQVFAIIYLLAMTVWAALMFQPLKANADVTGFTWRYARWSIEHVTGFVVSSQTSTHTYGRIISGHDPNSGNQINRSYITTDIHNNMQLVDINGQRHNAHLVNFGDHCAPDNIVSVWYACKGRKRIAFAALNLTTRERYKPPRREPGIGNVINGHPNLLFLGFFGAMIAAFLGGGGAIALFILMFALLAIGWNFSRVRFLGKGMDPLWAVSRQEEQALQAAAADQS